MAAFAALAGSANDGVFVQHTSWLMAGAAAAFAVAALYCLLFLRRLRRAAHTDTPSGVPRPASRQRA